VNQTASFASCAGGAAGVALGVLHVWIVVKGPWAYRYFGAGEALAVRAEKGSPLPGIVTGLIAIAFFLFGLYGFSGAGLIRRLPALDPVLAAIGTIFALRGVLVVPLVLSMVFHPTPKATPKEAIFSLVSLLIGVCYLAGHFLC
jgi:hypothetical protein